VQSEIESSPTASERRAQWRKPAFLVASLLLVGTGAVWVNSLVAANERMHPTPVSDVPRFERNRLQISGSFAERIGLETAPATRRHVAPVLEVTGEVKMSPHHVAAVGTRIFGRAQTVDVVAGQTVTKGQRLATFESAALGAAEAELLAARAREDLARLEKERKAALVEEKIAAHRSAERTLHQYDEARAHRLALAHRVEAMGGKTRRETNLGEFTLRAPIAGEIIQIDLFRGQAVDPGHTAFTIADLSSLWIELAVFESDLATIGVGDEVMVHPVGRPTLERRGRIEHVSSVVSPESRTAAVRVLVDNHDRRLRVGESVRARVIATGAGREAVAIMRRAVVLVDGRPTVFVANPPLQIEPRAVELGARGIDLIAVDAGLEAGEQVVVQGVFALKSELFR